jgi:hypothetical protein
MPNVVTCVVDPGGTGGYTSLFSAEAAFFGATSGDLVSNDENVVVRCICTNSADDTRGFTIQGFTTDATRNIVISAGDGFRHSGVFPSGENIYRLNVSTIHCVDVSDDYVELRGLAIKQSQAVDNRHVVISRNEGCVVSDCYLEVEGNGNTGAVAFYTIGTGSSVFKSNIVISDTGLDGTYLLADGSSTEIYNNTFYGWTYAVASITATAICINNLTFNNTDDYTGSFHPSSDYNATDGSGCGEGSNNVDLSTVSAASIFVDATAKDLHLLDTGSNPCVLAGANLYASGVTIDVNGTVQPTSGSYSIGADWGIINAIVTVPIDYEMLDLDGAYSLGDFGATIAVDISQPAFAAQESSATAIASWVLDRPSFAVEGTVLLAGVIALGITQPSFAVQEGPPTSIVALTLDRPAFAIQSFDTSLSTATLALNRPSVFVFANITDLDIQIYRVARRSMDKPSDFMPRRPR